MNKSIAALRQDFLQFALSEQALKFGQFTLKSGRISPYFFNSGIFNSGAGIMRLTRFYAETIVESGIEFEVLFGPAYKGIPLAALTCACLAEYHGKNVKYAFNRKEAKSHGEGGDIVGAELGGRVMIIDDVITAGVAIREAIAIITAHKAQPAGIVISLDREERGTGKSSAIDEISKLYGIPVISIAGLNDLIALVESSPKLRQFKERIKTYRDKYGA